MIVYLKHIDEYLWFNYLLVNYYKYNNTSKIVESVLNSIWVAKYFSNFIWMMKYDNIYYLIPVSVSIFYGCTLKIMNLINYVLVFSYAVDQFYVTFNFMCMLLILWIF